MATLFEYFLTAHSNCLKFIPDGPWLITATNPEVKLAVYPVVYFDYQAVAKYTGAYIPASEIALHALRKLIEERSGFSVLYAGLEVTSGGNAERPIASRDLVDTKIMYAYLDQQLTVEQKSGLEEFGRSHNVFLVIRDEHYRIEREKWERPYAFISHDSRDKQLLVKDVVEKLFARVCPVWYDEYSLKPGDSLVGSIDAGLKACRRCIAFITPHFLENKGWCEREYAALVMKEQHSGKRLLVPIWHGVTRSQVYEYDAALADRVAIIWNDHDKEASLNKIHRALLEPLE